uniref:BED-type domain-containing protein n=1 Tax=Lactuca sativa TaxID=4236 RepID=A0A9R1VWS2_LACSA|nr:hypothetical protein LSAT_V11C400196650 [Lactuca sativa]
MACNASTTSIGSTTTGAHKRNSNDVGWEYGVIPDKSNMDRLKCTLCGKVFGGGIFRMKQHIAHMTGNVSSCPKSKKYDQLKCLNNINRGKLKKKAKKVHIKDLRVEVRQELDDSMDELENSLGSMAPNVIGPMDNFANIINHEEIVKAEREKMLILTILP